VTKNYVDDPEDKVLRSFSFEELLKQPIEQFGALVSFTFNEGANNLRISNLLRDINSGNCDPNTILADFLRFTLAGGNPDALVARCTTEAIYLTMEYIKIASKDKNSQHKSNVGLINKLSVKANINKIKNRIIAI
jgi:hypothetical protein